MYVVVYRNTNENQEILLQLQRPLDEDIVLWGGINRNKYKQVCMYNVKYDDTGLKFEIQNKI